MSAPRLELDADERRLSFAWADPVEQVEQAGQVSGFEQLEAVRGRRRPLSPFAALLGFELVALERGRVAFAVEPREHVYNHAAIAHGGFFCALADEATGSAVQSLLSVATQWTTVSLTVNLVRRMTAATGRIVCEGSVVHEGRTLVTAAAEARDAAGLLYFHGQATCLVLALRA